MGTYKGKKDLQDLKYPLRHYISYPTKDFFGIVFEKI
jgi:hypothetical protein